MKLIYFMTLFFAAFGSNQSPLQANVEETLPLQQSYSLCSVDVTPSWIKNRAKREQILEWYLTPFTSNNYLGVDVMVTYQSECHPLQ